MALTPAERTRAFRERQKAAQQAALKTPTKAAAYVQGKFSEFIGNRTLEFDENLDAYGIRIMGTGLDEELQQFETEHQHEAPLTSLERSMALVGVFIDAAKELSELVNAFKLQEIERAIEHAIKLSADLPRGDVDALKASFAEIERLKAIRSDLRKPTRHTVASIRAQGE